MSTMHPLSSDFFYHNDDRTTAFGEEVRRQASSGLSAQFVSETTRIRLWRNSGEQNCYFFANFESLQENFSALSVSPVPL
jgi:hypothetical protein